MHVFTWLIHFFISYKIGLNLQYGFDIYQMMPYYKLNIFSLHNWDWAQVQGLFDHLRNYASHLLTTPLSNDISDSIM